MGRPAFVENSTYPGDAHQVSFKPDCEEDHDVVLLWGQPEWGWDLSATHRAGELTPAWVPEQEVIRDLTQVREYLQGLERLTKQQLNAFLLRLWPPLCSGEMPLDRGA